MTIEPVRAGSDWLALREPCDAAARAPELVEELRPHLPNDGGTEIHDLGCGTGSMARWLAVRLSGPQRWVLYDRDAELLAHAAADPPGAARDGAAVTVETRRRDIARLDPGELMGADLITASALLDMMTAQELRRLVTACARAGCPVLITLSVIGRVELTPADPLDQRVMAAFNAHQRRTTGAGRLLGPDAGGAAVDGFTRMGFHVVSRPSPWRLGPHRSALAAEWFTGWLGAACEQRPELGEVAASYARRRREEMAAGSLSVTVHHQDLLARPSRLLTPRSMSRRSTRRAISAEEGGAVRTGRSARRVAPPKLAATALWSGRGRRRETCHATCWARESPPEAHDASSKQASGSRWSTPAPCSTSTGRPAPCST